MPHIKIMKFCQNHSHWAHYTVITLRLLNTVDKVHAEISTPTVYYEHVILICIEFFPSLRIPSELPIWRVWLLLNLLEVL
jgi:hypothetical protein